MFHTVSIYILFIGEKKSRVKTKEKPIFIFISICTVIQNDTIDTT